MPATRTAALEGTVSAEEHYALMTELRDLKNTVAALRNKLELEQIESEKAVQAAHAAAASTRAPFSACRPRTVISIMQSWSTPGSASASGLNGISLYSATASTLTRTGTYYRKWGDSFPNLGRISEAAF